ncbi:MAG: TonB-dependent receptor [Burkholderiales bacterium]|nr:TonB-dependent receptor [Burkholderiales bacterium]
MVGARAELEGGGNGFDLLIGLSGRTAEDFDTPLGRAEHSRYQSYGLDFNVGYSPKDSAHQSRYELSGRYQHVDTERAGGLGAAPGYPKRLLREEPIVEQYLRLGYQGKNYGVFADTLDVSVYRRHFETDIYQTNRTSPASTANVHLKVYTPLVWGGHLTALKNVGDHLIGYGADFLHERNKGRRQEDDVTNNATGVTTHRPWRAVDRTRQQTDIGVFVTDEWKTAERLTLSGALRFDWVKATIGKEPAAGENAAITAAFGDHPGVTRTAVTGNVGAVFKLTPVWDLTANVSRGFRAPAGEMTTTGTAGAINNLPAPDLNPEYSKSLEVGTRWHSDAHFGSLVGYLTRYTDLIVSTRIDSNNFQRKNIGKAEIAGIELEGFWQFASSWQLRYMATYTRGTDKSSDVPLDYIAPLVGRLALRYDRETWYGEGVWRGYKGKTRIDPSKERTSGSYSMIDLYAGAKLDRFGSAWRGWKVIAGIENVFDRVGRNPTVYEDIAFARNVTNPLVEPGRNFVLKIVSEY